MLLNHGRVAQIGVQLLGIGACVAWTMTSAWLMFVLLRKFVGLRVSLEEEMAGINIAGHGQAVATAGAGALSAEDAKTLV